jgi:hypothetical protein
MTTSEREDRSTAESAQDEPIGPADGWVLPDAPPDPSSRRPPYARSVGWAVLVWAMTLAAVYLSNQIAPKYAGLIVPAGFMLGIWLGGRLGGILGRREWGTYVIRSLAVAFLLLFLFALGGCVYAMALYG